MAGIAFLIAAAFFFSVAGVIVLLVRTSGQKELLREYGKRLGLVEEALRLAGRAAPRAGEEVYGPAESPETAVPPDAVEPAFTETAFAEPRAAGKGNVLTAFIRGGNLWAAGGILLLLAGFATLAAYLANRGFFTVEMGIAAAVLCGLIMLILGWLFRKRRPLYFLLLQGGGIGILYFSVFAAHKLTPHVSSGLGLVFMSLLIPSAVALALFQNSQTLALAGFLGGFTAPLLIWGGGSQIFLFAYYLVLDLGVLCIGFFRRWRLLSLLALLYSLIFANVWARGYYEPELFRAAEPFFLAYILIFTVLSLRGAGGAPGHLDAALVLGTPLLGAPLQWKVFEQVNHGRALICVVFSAFYILLAFVLWKRRKTGERRFLCEAYLGFGALLANLAIPLELSPRLSSALWAAEGLAVFVFGLRQRKTRIALAALILHAAGAAAFFFEAGLGQGPPFRSAGFTGSLVIALSALAMAYYAGRAPRPWSRPGFSLALSLWAFAWWFGGWGYEIYRCVTNPGALLFLVCSLSAPAAYGASRRLKVPAFRLGMIPSLAGGLCIFLGFFAPRIPGFFTLGLIHNYFAGPYLWAWLAFFAAQGLLIFLSRREFREDLHGIWILIAVSVSLGAASSSGRFFTVSRNLAPAWTSFAGLLPVFAAMAAIAFLARNPACLSAGEGPGEKPAFTRRRLVFYILPLGLSWVMGLWFLFTLFFSGDPSPLPFYIPVLNPLDLEELFCIVLFLFWQAALIKSGDLPAMTKRVRFVMADIMVFLYAIAAAARAVHFYAGVPYWGLAYSDTFHLCLFVLWAAYGLGHIVWGNRSSRRGLWIAGAVLLIADTAKFLLLDQAGAGTVVRIVSFFLAGFLFLFVGWAAPLPPSTDPSPERDRP
jgi:uncharacterized membrane protein